MANGSKKKRRGGKRPGSGGRQPADRDAAITQATSDLVEALGEPQKTRAGKSEISYWVADDVDDGNGYISKNGDGVLVARLSTKDLQKGETAMGQIHSLVTMAQALGLKPREIIVATNHSGSNDFEERWDFARIADGIRSGQVKWVAYRNPDRLARQILAAEQFLRLLDRTGTDLYLASESGKFTEDGRLKFQIESLLAEREAKAIKKRTHDAIERRYVAEGKGYPNSQRFGFRRNRETRFLEVDPEQWPFVKAIHLLYGSKEDEKTLSIRDVADRLEDMGCPISEERIRAILRDPIYVTGEWTTTYQGKTIANRPIPLDDPIPSDLFESNNALLQLQRGRSTVTPPGTFLFNGVPLYHAGCLKWKGESGPALKARSYSDKKRGVVTPKYAHPSPVPSGCRGKTYSVKKIDKAVIKILRELCENPALIEEWAKASPGNDAKDTQILSDSELREANGKVRELRRAKMRLEEQLAERAVNGDLEDLEDAGNAGVAIQALERQIETQERRVEISKTLVKDMKLMEAKREKSRATLLEAIKEILTEEPQDDPALRARRGAFVRAAISRGVIRETKAGVELQLFGPLVGPIRSPLPADPLLDGMAGIAGGHRPQNGKPDDPELGVISFCLDSQTDPYGLPCWSVWESDESEDEARFSWRSRPVPVL